MKRRKQRAKKVILSSIVIIALCCVSMISSSQFVHASTYSNIGNNTQYVDSPASIYDIYGYWNTYNILNNNRKKYKIPHIWRIKGATYIDEENNVIIANPNDILVLVNKERNLPADYEPEDLVIPDVPFPFEGDKPKKYMRQEAAKALEQLFVDAQHAGVELYALSGYRSYKTQEANFNREARLKGESLANKTVAYPGQSEHQTGLAMDITRKSAPYLLDCEFGQTPEGIWLYQNCHRYGFIIRYPEDKEYITGYSYEPWHIRYVGREVAQYLYDNNLTLEEFFLDY